MHSLNIDEMFVVCQFCAVVRNDFATI